MVNEVNRTQLDFTFSKIKRAEAKSNDSSISNINTTHHVYATSEKKNSFHYDGFLNIKKIENIKQINENNYVYLGSTNMSLLNNMGITLDDDGSLLLIKGRSHDLFSGIYQKYANGGFKYQGLHIENEEKNDVKFKELYVDHNGDLIGNKREPIGNDHIVENKTQLYKIKFNKIEKEYDLNELSLNDNREKLIVEYEEYIPRNNQQHDLSSINNILELKENNIINICRDGLNISVKLKDNQLVTSGLPALLSSQGDEVDNSQQNNIQEYKIKLPLKKQDKILAIKPILDEIQLVVDKGDRIKIYYLDPLNIFATKPYCYEVTRLKQEPPLSFYSMIGENNYKKYHSGQPFSSQTIGNFSSRHIPFFSSFIDNARLNINKAKEQYALKEYKKMVKNIAKAVDPGFRGLFCNIKQIFNSSTNAYNSKQMALHGIKENIGKSYSLLNRVVKGIRNGITQGEVIYSLVKDLKEKESITINHYNDVRAFFGINAFHLSNGMGVNAFLLASYAKSHAITLSKDKDNKITFSFINHQNNLLAAGLSVGIGEYAKKWGEESMNYGYVTPIMASALLSASYAKKSNFSFSLHINDVSNFINKGVNLTENQLISHSTLETHQDMSISVGSEVRSEASIDVDVMLTPDTQLTVPRNAIGVNFIFNLLKLNLNINKFIDYGELDITKQTKKVDLDLLELGVDVYRDLKFTPSTTNSEHIVQWYPLASVKDFELMLQKRVNSLLSFTLFENEKLKNEEVLGKSRKDLKGIYKRVLKINRLLEKFPEKYQLSNNINKLDSIYLNLSSDKKPINNLKDKINKNIITTLSQGKDENFKTQTQTQTQTQITKENRQHNISLFLSSLKGRKETLSSQEKNNMNEKFKPYLIANYQLNEKSRLIHNEFRNEINHLIEENRDAEQINLDKIKKSLDDLYTTYKQRFANAEYQITSTDIMSVSELSYKKKTLPTGFIRLGNKKVISHSQVKGSIDYIYSEDRERINKISTNYYY